MSLHGSPPSSLDYSQTGFLSAEDFIQVLSSRDLGLQLDENELLYIVGQVVKTTDHALMPRNANVTWYSLT